MEWICLLAILASVGIWAFIAWDNADAEYINRKGKIEQDQLKAEHDYLEKKE